jgi:transposase
MAQGGAVEIVYSRVAGIDVRKKQVTVAVRTPSDQPGQRRQRVRRFATYRHTLQELTAWLAGQQVTHVTMEATGVYWKPVFHALAEAEDLQLLLVNAHHVKDVPGRETDAVDAAWLVPTKPVRRSVQTRSAAACGGATGSK